MPLKTRILNFFRIALWQIPLWQKKISLYSRGKAINHWVCKLLPNHYQFPRNTNIECERFGLNWRLDLSQLLEWHFYFDIQEVEFELLFKEIRSGQKILDIGANFGFPALPLAQLVKPQGHVYCFEPFPATFEKLQQNVQRNHIESISIFPIALGDISSTITMNEVNEHNAGQAKVAIQQSANCFQVIQMPLDSFAEQYHLNRIDFIKIDVEGYEMHVLNGAKKLLQRDQPILFIEVSDLLLKEQGSSAEELLRYLHSFGYALYQLPNLLPLDFQASYLGCHMNVLATGQRLKDSRNP